MVEEGSRGGKALVEQEYDVDVVDEGSGVEDEDEDAA